MINKCLTKRSEKHLFQTSSEYGLESPNVWSPKLL